MTASENTKATISCVLGVFALANVVVLGLFFAFDPETLDRSGAWWMLLPFFGLVLGGVAAFLGSLGWIDVRRGATDARLRQAQVGAILGGTAAGLMLLAIVVLIVMLFLLVAGLANEAPFTD